MNLRVKLSLVAGFTFMISMVMYEGWFKPLITDSATNTYYFTLDGTPQNLGSDGSTVTSVPSSNGRHYYSNTKISMTAGTYNSLQYMDARSTTNWQTMVRVYGPAYGTSQILTAPTITIGTRDYNGTSNPIYWKADVYDYNPSGSTGNGVLLWSSTGTDESHSYTTAPLGLYFNNPAAKSIPTGHRLKVIISCRQTSTNSSARLYWGSSTNYSFLSVTESTTAANTATVTNLSDYSNGALRSVVMGQQNVAMLKFDLFANASSTWSGGKLDKIGSNTSLGDAVYSIYKDTNGNGQFDAGSDTMIGGPYSFSQATGSGYTLSAPQTLSAIPQRYFVTYGISGNATPSTTVGARIADNSYFTVSSGTVTNTASTSSSLPNINFGSTPVTKTYAADWDLGTTLIVPQTGGPTTTNSTCVTSTVTDSAGTSLVGLLNFPSHTCTSIATGTYHNSSAANAKFVTLYFNGAMGYTNEQAQVRGISFRFRARSSNSSGTFTLRLFYVKPDGTRVDSPVASTYTTSDARTVTVSLAGQTFTNVPAGSRLGIQIGVSKANCGIGLGGAVGSQLVVAESPMASTGVNIGDGGIVLGGNVLASDVENAVNSFTLASNVGNQTFTSVTITGGPTTTSTNVAAARLYADNGTLGEFDSADTLLGSGTFVGNSTTITGLSEAVSGTQKYYLVTYDISATPQTNIALTGLVTGLGGGITIDSNIDISSGTLTILPTTTVTNGSGEPVGAVVAPGGAATNLNAFGLKVNGGANDTINSVTVSLMPAGISTKIAKVEIVDRNTGTVYGETSAPNSGDDWRLFMTGLLATSSTTECYIRISPKKTITAVHTMTGQVAAITHSRSKNGVVYEDSTSATLTIDGQYPSEPVLTASPGGGSGQIELSWSAATDSSGMSSTRAYTVVRGIVNAPAPTSCASGVPVYQGTALSKTEDGLDPGQTYSYRVCATDIVNNTSKGTTASAVTTIPTVCTNAPSISVRPLKQFVKTGEDRTYGISVSNQDTGACGSSTFTLTVVGTENSDDFITPSILGANTMTLGPNGGGGTTSLTVKAKSTAQQGGSNSISVRVSEANHPPADSPAIVSIVNNSGAMLHSSMNLGQEKYGVWGDNHTCTTCHSKGGSPNIKKVAPFILTPNGSRPVTFNRITGSQTVGGIFGNDLRTGTTSQNVCEVCHHKTRFHQYSVAKVAVKTHNNGKECMACHPHNKGFKYMGGASCDDCHGDPPTSFSTMAYPATNALGFFAPNAGAHAKHSPHMVCATCHSNANHAASQSPVDNKMIEMGFNINNANFPGFAGSVSSGTVFTGNNALNNGYLWATAPGTNLVQAPNMTTCSVYCHGWSGSGGYNSTPSWVGTSQKGCGSCHLATSENPPTWGSHNKHAGNDVNGGGIPCKTCHGGYANYSTSPAHTNGRVEWNLSAVSPEAAYRGSNSGTTGAGAPSNPANWGTCTNIYCHSNVQTANGAGAPSRYATPQWGGVTVCGSCHDDMAVSSAPTGGHRQHVQDPQTQFECRICHATGGATNPDNHANRKIDFNFSGQGSNTVYSKGAYKVPGTSTYGSCSSSNCHGRQTINWEPASALPLCNKCHGSASTAAFYDTRGPASPTGKSETYVGSHDQHIKAAPYNYANPMKCSECHIEPGGAYSPGHLDTTLPAEVTFGPIASSGSFYGYTSTANYTASGQRCSNLWCHGGGMASNTGSGNYAGCAEEGGTLGTPVKPTWSAILLNGNPANDCSRCHSYPPCAPGPGYVHYGKAPTDCNSCHNNVKLDGSGFIDPSLHVNGVVDGCFNCHGRPPVDAASLVVPALKALAPGSTGAHNAHQLNPNIGTDCSVCHNNFTHQMPSYDLQMGFNAFGGKMTSGIFYGYSSIVNNVYVSSSAGTTVRRTNDSALLNRCTNLYCHGGGTATKPGLTGGVNNQPNWELGNDQAACGSCHGVTAATYSTTGSHARHLSNGLSCDRCHGVKENNYHVNGSVEWTFNTSDVGIGATASYRDLSSGGTDALAPSTSFGSCANIYCHSNVQGAGGIGEPTIYRTPQWGSGPLGCGACHMDMGTDPAATGSHAKHTFPCDTCHNGAGSGSAKHANHTIDISFNGLAAGTTYSAGSHTPGSGTHGTCTNISCHGNETAVWGGTVASPTFTCIGCHGMARGNRAGVASHFAANSHHVQGVAISVTHCYQCHWEADVNGFINPGYHQKTSNAPVDLVIYGGDGQRPQSRIAGTFVSYSANGNRKQVTKINQHCLGCHNDQNSTAMPFGDGKTPRQYAWDAASIAGKFSDTGTTPWGKYIGTNVTPKNARTKAFSAHGNATANQGGWNTSETWPNNRAGAVNVVCFDCHNSHGSTVSGKTTSYASATVNGGILKDTTAGKGGYAMTYRPQPGGSSAGHNVYTAGAGLCFDCHLTTTAGTTPWGYSGTFGATQKIGGYADTDYFGPGTFGYQTRFTYKATPSMGGHFGASSSLSSPPDAAHQIGGLCTPCHDPHGISPTLGTNRQFAVPMLKGTWLTSPYKEDVAPADNAAYQGIDENPGPLPLTSYNDTVKAYKIDQNTFASGTITQTETQFAGLCLNCHPKTSLTDGTTHTWKDKNRVHQSVKGWKTANATIKHNYSCSKCHTPHNASLPRLMVTNCLNSKHRGRMTNNSSPVTSGNYLGQQGSGSGRMPGIYAYSGDKGSGNSSFSVCHEGNDSTHKWNEKTQW